ncbi:MULTISPECIES: hypothetical protein [Legionella]|uniref:hypothetical protein n=1 Tax=Legionella TaxID=445 RepID=UPI0007302A2F|nr:MULTISPECIES: hypothetical protein [Legionella]PJE12260.1 MAG: hypothetical protein CK430_07640 [Legionella sp.]
MPYDRFLHISPGDLGYGSPLLGLSLYSWSAISFGIIIAIAAIAFLFEQGFTEESPTLAIGFIFL